MRPNHVFLSDKITLSHSQVDANNQINLTPVNLIRTGIAWASDKKYKFKNPVVPPEFGSLKDCKLI